MFAVGRCLADEFPIAPDKHLTAIKRIPARDQIILEVRHKLMIDVPNEIGVFDLTTHTETKWDVLSDSLRETPATAFGSQADWAPVAGKLLYATNESVHLISRDGTATELHLQMPGKLSALKGMSAYALSADGQRVAYMLYTRDSKDLQPDPYGKLYIDLMYQQIDGSTPISIWNDQQPIVIPAWRPDGAAIAHTDSDGNVVVSDLNGRTLWSLPPGPTISGIKITYHLDEIRWDPSGKRLAFLMNQNLYLVNADGSERKVIRFQYADKYLSIDSFAWSADGRKFAFRAEAGETCNYGAVGYKVETGHFPCIDSRNLFTSDVDASNVAKVTRAPDYDLGELFWIQ